ncbi:MAG: hypothetical protein IKI39_08300 [Oscillospiraceae bacterium]|nr:hypothetical protein [Oscillospiraceae bacterium]
MGKREKLHMAAFLLLALCLVLTAWAVFDRKTSCWYTEKVRGFYQESKQSMDVIGFGSSRMYCTLDPLVLHHKTGLRAYVLATQQQPLRATWYYMREALGRQSPRLLILEATMAFRPDSEITDAEIRDCLDPLPWSKNKLTLIRELVPAGQRAAYYFNFLKYHQRWKELSAKDFDFSYLGKRDVFRGYMYLTPERGADCRQQSYDSVEALSIPEENLALLREMAQLAEENGASLLLLAAPYEAVTDDLGYLRSLHAFCEAEGIAFLDLNLVYDELGIDNGKDFFDIGHFNVSGSTKATKYIADYISRNYALSPIPDAELDAELKQAYEDWIVHPPVIE